jgi:hypothetical protein
VQAVAADGTIGAMSAEVGINIVTASLNCHVPTVAQQGLSVTQQMVCEIVWPVPGQMKYAHCAQWAEVNGQESCILKCPPDDYSEGCIPTGAQPKAAPAKKKSKPKAK